MRIDPAALESAQALLLGLAFSGLIASAVELATARRAGLSLLWERRGFLLAPALAVSAPFLILRRAVSPGRFERARPGPVMAATIVAGLWALACGEIMLGLAHRIAA